MVGLKSWLGEHMEDLFKLFRWEKSLDIAGNIFLILQQNETTMELAIILYGLCILKLKKDLNLKKDSFKQEYSNVLTILYFVVGRL